MKKYMLAIVFLISVAQIHAADTDVAVTVYNNDLALIKQYRTIPLQKGVQSVKYKNVAARIEPTSVHFKSLTSEKMALLEQNFEYDLVGTERLLEKYINQDIFVMTKEAGTFSGTLLNTGGGDIILQDRDGQVKIVKYGALESLQFPTLPDGLVTQPTLLWLLNVDKAGNHQTEISYLTRGMNWHAEYVAVTNAKDRELQLGAWVSIENRSGATYKDAKLKLVAGDVNIKRPEKMYKRAGAGNMAFDMPEAPHFEEKAFFEYHLYDLPRPATIKDRQMKQLSLFPDARVQVDKIYTYNGQQDGKKVRVNLEFKNSKAAGLGLPLPGGKIRVYKEDEDGSQEFVGEDLIDHTPKDEKVRVYLGNAFDIVGERIVKDVQKIGRRSRRETMEITLRNHKDEALHVIVVEQLYGDWEFVGDTPPIKKKDAQMVEFDIFVDKDSEKVFEYTVHFER